MTGSPEKPRPRVVAIIQARMGSTRLPGKTMADISGKPLLLHVIERVKASQTVDQVVVATTTDPEDQAIMEMAARQGLPAYAGSPDDVLDRFYHAGLQASAGVVVRVTADDPFKDPQVLDLVVGHLLGHPGLDYASNAMEPTYPEGLDIEAFWFSALERTWTEARLPSDREHVTTYIWTNPHLFNIASIKHPTDLSHLRWTLDYEEDLRFAREVYDRLYRGEVFLMGDILSLLEAEPHLARINEGIQRNAGYARSLERDAAQQMGAEDGNE